jgi:CubicO group peptidase (beta-lactamase class C family)
MTHASPAVELDENKIDAIFAGLTGGQLPGAAVGIAIEGRPVYRKGFGLANLELSVALSPSIRMRIGSTSKLFTALACLLLCEEGKASIDDSLGRHLPELNAVARNVTLRQLMANTSGLRDATDVVQQFSGVDGRLVSTSDLLDLYRALGDASAAPDATFMYNNGGWVLLSVALERIADRSLEDLMRERIFAPLGMRSTLVRRRDAEYVTNSAAAHTLTASGAYEKGEYCGGIDYAGAGAIVSTVDDMLRWMAEMDAPTIGSARTWQAIKTPHALVNGTTTGYGLGLRLERIGGIQTLHHAGGGNGSNAQMLKVPAARLDIVVLANRSDISSIALAHQVMTACLPGLDPFDAPVQVSTHSTGTFASPATRRVVQLFAREGQQFAAIDGFEMTVGPDSDGVLWPTGAFTTWKTGLTLFGPIDRPTAIHLNDFGNRDELVAQAAAEAGGENGIVGRYCSRTTGTEATIVRSADELHLRTVGRFGSASFKLTALAPGIWRARAGNPLVKPLASVLSFDAEGSFRFSNVLTRALSFERIGS